MKKLSNYKVSENGFTLVETLIALLLISFALLAIYRVHLSSTKISTFNRNLVLATQFAKSKIETIKAETFSQIANGSDNSTSASDISGTNVFFLRTWQATPLAGYPNTLQIQVNVGWTIGTQCPNISQCAHSIALNTFVANF